MTGNIHPHPDTHTY